MFYLRQQCFRIFVFNSWVLFSLITPYFLSLQRGRNTFLLCIVVDMHVHSHTRAQPLLVWALQPSVLNSPHYHLITNMGFFLSEHFTYKLFIVALYPWFLWKVQKTVCTMQKKGNAVSPRQSLSYQKFSFCVSKFPDYQNLILPL